MIDCEWSGAESKHEIHCSCDSVPKPDIVRDPSLLATLIGSNICPERKCIGDKIHGSGVNQKTTPPRFDIRTSTTA